MKWFDYFDMWYADKVSMMDTMVRNMAADLAAGYDYFGSSISRQRREIDEYRAEFDAQMDAFKAMDEDKVGRWCFFDMKKRGVIA